jgi:hypothetical protein
VAGALANAALAYAYRGWPVFPCRANKRPISPHGFKDATTDEAQIRAWWAAEPSAAIGYPTGALVVVDVDGPLGVASMNHLRKRHDWPRTLTSMSGRPGLHMFFRCPEGETIGNAAGIRGGRGLGKGIDVRGSGGYVLLPPSPHPTGRRYQWTTRVEPVELPAWMAAKLRKPKPKPLTVPQRDPEGWARGALGEAVDAVLLAAEGTLNDELNRQAFRLGRLVGAGALSESHVREALLHAAVRAGHPERGAERTISSGLGAGMRAR